MISVYLLLDFVYPHKYPQTSTWKEKYLCIQKTNIFINMDSKNISFNDMPKMIAVMYDKLNELGDKVDRLMPTEKSEEPQWMNVAALIEYLPNHPAEQTVYGWTSARKIPFHKRGKSILFNKTEIDQWLSSGTYRKSQEEMEQEAMSFINSKRYGRR